MNRARIWPVIRRIWITAGLVFTAVFVSWSLLAYRANAEARAALQSDARVAVRHQGTYRSFDPATPAAAGLLFFAGGLVDPVAYAPLARSGNQRAICSA